MTHDNTNTWPDPARPGVPLNPEREGWHWGERDGGLEPRFWSSGQQLWAGARNSWITPKMLAALFNYAGPALTPAEVDARVKEARRDAVDAFYLPDVVRRRLEDAIFGKRAQPMNTDKFRALVEAGPAAVMVAKEDMLKLLDEYRYWRKFGKFQMWLVLVLLVLRFLDDAAKSCFWGVAQ